MYLFLGGDERSPWAMEYLRQKGFPVCHCRSTEELPWEISCLILPIPSFRRGSIPGCGELSVKELAERLKKDSRIYCYGKALLPSELLRQDVKIIDLSQEEGFLLQNALATAEAALALAVEHSPVTIHGSECLVIGAGRIGLALAQRLQALGARVCLSSRKASDRAKASSLGYRPEKTGLYEKGLEQYNFLFNTVPSPILSKEQLARLKKDCLLIELASEPGGFDPAQCKTLGLSAIHAQGLPGKYSPKTAGICYGRYIEESEVSP